MKVFEVDLPEHSTRLQELLFVRVFKDRCNKCNLPNYIEIESPPIVDLPSLKLDFGVACGFWLARRDFARLLCAEFEGQFELRKISDDAYFVIFKNLLIPDDPDYKNSGERICSLCGEAYIRLWEGYGTFKGKSCIEPRGIYETSIRFGSVDVKYPHYVCGEEAAYALRAISRRFKFVKFPIKFSGDAG